MYGSYVDPRSQRTSDAYQRALPKYERYNYYFGVFFPNKNSHLFGNLEIWITTSGILVLVVAFFAWAVLIVLRQKQLAEVQKDFIDNMTHEFKTPITTIGLSAKALASMGAEAVAAQPERYHQYLDIVRQENNRLLTQVEKVLHMARIDRQQVKLNREAIDLAEIAAQVVQTVTNSSHHPITFNNKLAQPALVAADRLHLTNIIFNLVDNAVKYGGAGPVSVNLSASGRPHELELSVVDGGPGISPAHQRQVFKKFYRVPTGNVHNVQGFGLGLHYVASMVRAHGWRIVLKSAAGLGCTFRIRIPIIT
jgi:two-component system, OmpR family, phosphate regulon sensor histidine kinase PhoR